MKRTNNMIKVFIAAIALSSIAFLNSCSKDMQDKSALQSSSEDDGVEATGTPVALWNFDSTWKEKVQHLNGIAHNSAKYGAPRFGSASFSSPDSGYISYNNAGTALPNLTTGFTVDFYVFAFPKTGGAQTIWCLPQTGAFWPDHHVLLDAYNSAQGDTALIKVMFKANKAIPYNEQWQVYGGIPNFYHRWSHVQYSYNGSTSKFTLKINGKVIAKHVTLYTDDPTNGGVPLGNLNPNPGTHGILIGAFQNQWDKALFGNPESWMLGFHGRIDNLKIYDTALF